MNTERTGEDNAGGIVGHRDRYMAGLAECEGDDIGDSGGGEGGLGAGQVLVGAGEENHACKGSGFG